MADDNSAATTTYTPPPINPLVGQMLEEANDAYGPLPPGAVEGLQTGQPVVTPPAPEENASSAGGLQAETPQLAPAAPAAPVAPTAADMIGAPAIGAEIPMAEGTTPVAPTAPTPATMASPPGSTLQAGAQTAEPGAGEVGALPPGPADTGAGAGKAPGVPTNTAEALQELSKIVNKPIETPKLPPVAPILPMAKPPALPEAPKGVDWATQLGRPVASFAREVGTGIGRGFAHTEDAIQALIPPPNALNQAVANATGLKMYPYESMEKDYEKWNPLHATPQEQQSIPAALAAGATEAASYMEGPLAFPGKALAVPGKAAAAEAKALLAKGLAEGMPAAERAALQARAAAAENLGRALRVGGSAAENAGLGALISRADQLAEKGKVDPNQVAADTALGALIGGAGAAAAEGLGVAAKKVFGKPEEDALQQGLKTVQGLQKRQAETAREIVEQAKMLADEIVQGAALEEQKGMEILKEALGPNTPQNELQAKQKETMEKTAQALRMLAGVEDLNHITTPEQVDALEQAFRSGLKSFKAIKRAIEEAGYAVQPLLIEMKKAVTHPPGETIVPPSPLERQRMRFKELEAEARELAVKQKLERAERTRQALEGQHGQPPVSRNTLQGHVEEAAEHAELEAEHEEERFPEMMAEAERATAQLEEAERAASKAKNPQEASRLRTKVEKLRAKADEAQGRITQHFAKRAKQAAPFAQKTAKGATDQAVQQTLKSVVKEAKEEEGAEPPKSPLEQAMQKLAPEKPPEEVAADAAAMAGVGASRPDEPGVFRRPLRGREYMGHLNAEHGIPFANMKGLIDEGLYKEGLTALKELGDAKALKIHAEDEARAAGEQAFDFALKETDPALQKEHLGQIKRSEKKTRTWASKQALAQKKAELKLAQDQAQKEELLTEKALLEEQARTAKELKKREAFMARISEIDATIQRLNHPLRGVERGEHTYTTSAWPERFEDYNASQRQPPKTFKEALDKFDKASDVLKAAEKRWGAARETHLPTMQKLATAYRQISKDLLTERQALEARMAAQTQEPERQGLAAHIAEIDDTLRRLHVPNDALQSKYISPTWEHPEPIAHPKNPEITTRAVTQVRYNPITDLLHGIYLQSMQEFERMQDNLANNFHVRAAYARIGRAVRMSPKDAHDYLAKAGLIHPDARRFGAVALLGATALSASQAAEAADLDSMTPKERKEHVGNLWAIGGVCGAVTAAALFHHFGPAAAKAVWRFPGWYWRDMNRTVTEQCHMADQALGITEPHLSLGHQLEQLRGSLNMAHTLCPDYPEALAAVSSGEYDGSLLSPAGLKAVRYAQEAEREFRAFAKTFIEEQWRPFYKAAPDTLLNHLNNVNSIMDFVHSAYVAPKEPRSTAVGDQVYAYMYKNITHGLFIGNVKSGWLGPWLMEHATVGPLAAGIGTDVYARAYSEYMRNPTLRSLLKNVRVGGPLSQRLGDFAEQFKEKPLLAEIHKAQVLYAATALKYFGDNKPEMVERGCKTWHDFVRWSIEADPDDSIAMDFHMKYANIAAQAIGADYTGLEKTFIERTKILKNLIWFTPHQGREAQMHNKKVQLIFTNAVTGDYRSMLRHAIDLGAFYVGKWQFGGALAVPAVFNYAAQNAEPCQHFIYNVNSFLNATSVGYQMFGILLNLGWDPIVPAATGMSNDMAEEFERSTSDLQDIIVQLGSTMDLVSEGRFGDIVTGGSSGEQEINQAHRGLVRLMRWISMSGLFPSYVSVPMRWGANFSTAIPHFMNAEYETSVPRLSPGGGGSSQLPLEGRHVYYAVPRVDANGYPIETQEQAVARAEGEAGLEALGFQGRTKSDIVEARRAAIMTGDRQDYPLNGVVRGR
jgi:hypothetical protein